MPCTIWLSETEARRAFDLGYGNRGAGVRWAVRHCLDEPASPAGLRSDDEDAQMEASEEVVR